MMKVMSQNGVEIQVHRKCLIRWFGNEHFRFGFRSRIWKKNAVS